MVKRLRGNYTRELRKVILCKKVMIIKMTSSSFFRQYKLLNLLEFNSSRKRMSVIVSDEDGQIFLLCKGADRFCTSTYI